MGPKPSSGSTKSATKTWKTVEPAGVSKDPKPASKTGRAPSRQVLQEKTQAQEKELDELRNQIAALKNTAATSNPAGNAGGGKANNTNNEPKVPKPRGSTGEGFCMRALLGVETEEEEHNYRRLLAYIRDVAPSAGLDYTKPFSLQSHDALHNAYKAVRRKFPEMRKYINNWPIAELIKQNLRNKRKYARRRGYIAKGSGGKSQTATRHKGKAAARGGIHEPPEFIEGSSSGGHNKENEDHAGSDSSSDEGDEQDDGGEEDDD